VACEQREGGINPERTGRKVNNDVRLLLNALRFAKLILSQWWFTTLAILSLISTALTFVPAFYGHLVVRRWIPLAVFGIAFFVASFRVHLKESAEVDALKNEIASLKNPAVEQRRRAERILSVMTQGKAMRLSELSRLSEIEEDDALQTLQALKATGRVIPVDPDEELPGTIWIRC
jgi:hypothetical protein